VACWGAVGVDGAFEAVWARHCILFWFVVCKLNGRIEALLSQDLNIMICLWPSLGMMSGAVLAARSGIVWKPANSYASSLPLPLNPFKFNEGEIYDRNESYQLSTYRDPWKE
jgi:hypothetical protein